MDSDVLYGGQAGVRWCALESEFDPSTYLPRPLKTQENQQKTRRGWPSLEQAGRSRFRTCGCDVAECAASCVSAEERQALRDAAASADPARTNYVLDPPILVDAHPETWTQGDAGLEAPSKEHAGGEKRQGTRNKAQTFSEDSLLKCFRTAQGTLRVLSQVRETPHLLWPRCTGVSRTLTSLSPERSARR